MNNLYLVHFGTKGQKWGERHWQNPDGTFNEAGKKRYFGTGSERKINKYKAKQQRNLDRANAKNAKLQKDIDSYKGHEKGIFDKNGNALLTKNDVKNQVNSLKAQQKANLDQANAKNAKIQNKIDKTMDKKVSEVSTADKEKARKIIGGVMVGAGVALMAYGAYKYAKSPEGQKAIASGKAALSNLGKSNKPMTSDQLKSIGVQTFEPQRVNVDRVNVNRVQPSRTSINRTDPYANARKAQDAMANYQNRVNNADQDLRKINNRYK